MKHLRKIRRYATDFIEIIIISVFGLIGLIFIFTTPSSPPEERKRSLWQRKKKQFTISQENIP